jgi:hypothetical protein
MRRPDDRTKSQRQSWIAVGMVMFILADEPTYRAQSSNINALPRGPGPEQPNVLLSGTISIAALTDLSAA